MLILHVSRTTKITVTLFTIISTYSTPLAAEKSGGATGRVPADWPYNGACCSGARLYMVIHMPECFLKKNMCLIT